MIKSVKKFFKKTTKKATEDDEDLLKKKKISPHFTSKKKKEKSKLEFPPETNTPGPLLKYILVSTFIPILASIIPMAGTKILTDSFFQQERYKFVKMAYMNQISSNFHSISLITAKKFMEIIGNDLEAIVKMRDNLFSQDLQIMSRDNGKYSPEFMDKVDSKKLKLECFSLLALINHNTSIHRYQRCFLLNDAYTILKDQMVKREKNRLENGTYPIIIDDKLAKIIPEFPCLVIGSESGVGDSVFYNLTDPENFKLLDKYHTELKYDIAVSIILSPFFIDIKSDFNIQRYFAYYESGMFYMSQNGINMSKPITETGYTHVRIDCSLNPKLGYSGKTGGYDPRCRPWMIQVSDSYENYKRYRQTTFRDFENSVPLIISPPYQSASSHSWREITICTALTRKNESVSEAFLNLAICNDLKFFNIKEYLSRSYLFNLLAYENFKEMIKTEIFTEQFKAEMGISDIEELNTKLNIEGYDKLIAVRVLNDLMSKQKIIGYMILYKASYKNNISGFRPYYFSWQETLDQLYKRIQENKTQEGDEHAYYIYNKLNDTTNRYIEDWNNDIDRRCQNPTVLDSDKERYTNCNEVDIESGFHTMVINASTSNEIKAIFANCNFRYTDQDNRDKNIPLFKIGLIYPYGLIHNKTKSIRDENANDTYVLIVVYAISIIIAAIIFLNLYYVTAKNLCISLNQLVYVFSLDEDESGKKFDVRAEHFMGSPQDVKDVFASFSLVKNIFEDATQAFELGNQTDALIKYSVALNLYTKIKNYKLAGIISNNIGNIHYNFKRFDFAIENYERAIQYAEELKQPYAVILRRKINLTICLGAYLNFLKEKKGRDYRNQTIYYSKNVNDRSKVKKLTEKFETHSGTLLSSFKESKSFDKCVFYCCQLSWIHLEMNNMQRCYFYFNRAKDHLEDFLRCSSKFQDNPTTFKIIHDQLEVEINIMRAKICAKKREYYKTLKILSRTLSKGERYSFEKRKRIMIILNQIFDELKLYKTPNFKQLYNHSCLSKSLVKNYIIGLDYSSSMGRGGRLEWAIKAILKLWDFYITEEDNVAFLRFNLNVEVVFDLGPKKLNEFQKRNRIESSDSPSERTALFDTIVKALRMVNRRFRGQETYIIIFCDGNDTSSLASQKKVEKMLKENADSVKLIAVGLGVNKKTSDVLEWLVKHSKGGAYINVEDEKFYMVFDMICSLTAQNSSERMIQEAMDGSYKY